MAVNQVVSEGVNIASDVASQAPRAMIGRPVAHRMAGKSFCRSVGGSGRGTVARGRMRRVLGAGSVDKPPNDMWKWRRAEQRGLAGESQEVQGCLRLAQIHSHKRRIRGAR